MTEIDLQNEFNNLPDQAEIAFTPITGIYSDRYTKWLQNKCIALQEIINQEENK